MSKKGKYKDKDEVSFEDQVPLEVALEYLQSLHDNLADGGVRIQNGASELVLGRPDSEIALKLRARTRDGENGLRLDFSWRAPEAEKTNGRASGLRITAAEDTGDNGASGGKKRKTGK